MYNSQDELALSVSAAAPNNAVLFDDKGNPSIMVRIPCFKISDVIEGGSDTVHPAFMVNGKVVPEIMVSKYSNVIIDSRAYSLPGRDPAAYIPRDDVKLACERKGKGWHLMSNAEWAAIALWCKKNGYMPSGNTSHGRDFYKSFERGVVTQTYERNGEVIAGRTATGSGPVAWAHDNSPAGIHDMNGNVWAQVSGFRLVDGEIQIIPDNNSALAVDESAKSPLWKGVLKDGTLVEPGSEGTLKIDFVNERLTICENITKQEDKWVGSSYKDIAANTDVPEILKALALFPEEGADYGEQKCWFNNLGERFPWRGGTWDAHAASGIFCLFTCYPRAHISMWMGFRSAYVNLN